MSEPVLETEGLTKRFDGITAVDNVSISVPSGTLKAIIGPNGAGKTTFFNLLSGVYPPTDGKIWYKGEDITRKRPDERSQKGLVRSFQLTQIFPNLSTLENIRLAAQSRGKSSTNYNMLKDALSYSEYVEKSKELLKDFELFDKANAPARDLSGADMRKLDVMMAIASEPEVLLLDEPTSGMAMEEIPEILDIITSLSENREDLTIVFIEHKVNVVMDIADSIFVLANGKVIADGTPKEIQEDEEVQKAYLGGT
ncbi:branched-chain amino acid ABC transporter substrate-binding protein [candidate division MSBL1 archaeon SCGC-AAA259I09]|uniref:Probable branched-chain amino acid transport ATP-binding protein LivG n=1 Tax=candidate division MSBL1 archaeon SCGC-AAA259I09 TaxID=1698267 RepID=A0A133UQ85_9EURY|nr:branched-chain amino acid ABC transporter substrate-binding protein [candidate division MSBL1 archaeon SCGC-AAA259I09]